MKLTVFVSVYLRTTKALNSVQCGVTVYIFFFISFSMLFEDIVCIYVKWSPCSCAKHTSVNALIRPVVP